MDASRGFIGVAEFCHLKMEYLAHKCTGCVGFFKCYAKVDDKH